MNHFRSLTAAALITSLACAGSASAASPRAGTYRGVAPQEGIRVDVQRHRHTSRVSSAALTYTMACEDGSSITRSIALGGARISRAGRFTIAESSGGGFGPHGLIRLSVRVSGHFTSARHLDGTFVAAATVTDSPISPAVGCSTGVVQWRSAR
jgi:hypothetical protein